MKETERVPKKAARQKYKSRDSLWVENSFNWNYSFITEKKGALQKYVPLCQKVSKVIQISTCCCSFKQTRLVYGSTLKYC